MARLRNVYRSSIHEDLVQRLSREKDARGLTVFQSIREVLCFAAVLGYSMKKYEDLPSDQKKDDVMWQQFEANDSYDYIYMIAVAHEKNLDVLKSESKIDMVEIFEKYIHGGLGVIQGWIKTYPGETPFHSIMKGLSKDGFISKKSISSKDILESIQF